MKPFTKKESVFLSFRILWSFYYQLIKCVSDSHKRIESNQMCFIPAKQISTNVRQEARPSICRSLGDSNSFMFNVVFLLLGGAFFFFTLYQQRKNGLNFHILFYFLGLYFVFCYIFLAPAFAISGLNRAVGGSTCGILLSHVKDSTCIQQLLQFYCLLLEITKPMAELASPHLFHGKGWHLSSTPPARHWCFKLRYWLCIWSSWWMNTSSSAGPAIAMVTSVGQVKQTARVNGIL